MGSTALLADVDISEDCYAARWLIGNEISLWRMLQGGDRRYGQCVVSDEIVEELLVLSRQANGWIWTGRAEWFGLTLLLLMSVSAPIGVGLAGIRANRFGLLDAHSR